MSCEEFVQRLQPGCALRRLAYAPREYAYMQAVLPAPLAAALLHVEPLLQSLAGGIAGGSGSGGDSRSSSGGSSRQLQLAQPPRLWVSPAGAVSPLHFDVSHSFLVQVAGRKRMLLWSPDQAYRLACYPGTHALRRRAAANVCDPDAARRWPLLAGAGTLEVALRPGDVLFFPSGWAHHTESLGGGDGDERGGLHSMSVTFRCKGPESEWA